MSQNESIGASADNSYICMYQDNDILDGIIIDFSETEFAFISAHSEGYDEPADKLEDIGATIINLIGIDYSSPPTSWIVGSLGRIIVDEAESLLD